MRTAGHHWLIHDYNRLYKAWQRGVEKTASLHPYAEEEEQIRLTIEERMRFATLIY